MKKLNTLSLLALCGAAIAGLAIASPLSIAQDDSDQQETPKQETPKQDADEKPKEEAKAESKELHDSMKLLEKNMRAMRSLMTKPEMLKEALANCVEMEKHILVGLQHAPDPHGELKDQTKLEYTVEFKRRMMTVYSAVLDLEIALEKGDADAARTAYRSLGAERRGGHQIFIPEEQQRRNRNGRGGRGGRGNRSRDGDK